MGESDWLRGFVTTPGVVMRRVGDDFVMVHPASGQAHALTGASALVWAAIAAGFDEPPAALTRAVVEDTLDQLQSLDLLRLPGISRRTMLRRTGVVTAGVGIATIAMPEVLAAASTVFSFSKTEDGPVSFTIPANNTNSAKTLKMTLQGGGGAGGAGAGKGGVGGAGSTFTLFYSQPAGSPAIKILGYVGAGGKTTGHGGVDPGITGGAFVGSGGDGGTNGNEAGGGGGAATYLLVEGASAPFVVASGGGGGGARGNNNGTNPVAGGAGGTGSTGLGTGTGQAGSAGTAGSSSGLTTAAGGGGGGVGGGNPRSGGVGGVPGFLGTAIGDAGRIGGASTGTGGAGGAASNSRAGAGGGGGGGWAGSGGGGGSARSAITGAYGAGGGGGGGSNRAQQPFGGLSYLSSPGANAATNGGDRNTDGGSGSLVVSYQSDAP